ncbi:hypothetical protein OH77DRAFT_1425547 [Trametes cingulata]|nr:hypothetical protein OH77DRAFT_1425547 [Trametes cingulata]
MGFNSKPSIKRTKPSNVFGHIPGVPVGSTFENRLFLHHSSVHSGILAGIAGSKHEGCYSVVLSGGYEDDKDEGYKFTYTGCGGRDRKDGEKPREGPQTCDQSWDNSRNMSLKVSAMTKKPVRVVRGYKSSSDFAPVQGYRYDGLYVVENAWMDVGKSGFKVCKFTMKRLPGQPPIPRREGTLHLNLTEWERPKHFGSESDRTSPSRSYSPEPSSKEKRKGKGKAVPRTRDGRPLIRRPKDSDTEDESENESEWHEAVSRSRAESSRSAGPSQARIRHASDSSSKPPAALPRPSASANPLTTKVSRPVPKPVAAQPRASPTTAPTPASAPQPDVFALLAEWSGSASKQTAGPSSVPPAQSSTQSTPRLSPMGSSAAARPPTSQRPAQPPGARSAAPSLPHNDAVALGARRPRSCESGGEDAAREVKRMKLNAPDVQLSAGGGENHSSNRREGKVEDVDMDLCELEYP